MSGKFHVNPETGDAGPCKATQDRCPFGTAEVHFSSIAAARSAYEEQMNSEEAAPLTKRKPAKWPNLEEFRSAVNIDHSVYINPDGRFAIHYVSRVQIYNPDGTPNKASSREQAVADIQVSADQWERLKGPGEKLISQEEYESKFVNKETNRLREREEAARNKRIREEGLKAVMNDENNYPKDSRLDTSKPRLEARVTTTRSDRAAMRHVGEPVNPHNSSLSGGVYEVWRRSLPSGSSVFVMVETTPDKLHSVKSKLDFAPRGSSSSEVWSMTGAFEDKEDGRVTGFVPDREMSVNRIVA